MDAKPTVKLGTGQMPGHDIFYTPRNDSRNPPYQDLPDSGSGLIECQLVHNTTLEKVRGRYTTLSYSAGDPQKTQKIVLNGVRFDVFANLGHALAEARHFWRKTYPDREFLLWVDQICINQTNIMERSHQVGFMQDIYRCAEQVLICLSTGKRSGRGVVWLQRLHESVPPLDHDLDDGKQLDSDVSITRFHWHRLKEHLWANTVDEQFMDEWLAVYDILESPWWSRAWVYQEIIASSEAYFLIANAAASIARKKQVKTAMEVVEFIVKSKKDWSGPADLKKLLAHSQYCNASDDRDRIYAFLGLAQSDYGIAPDYCMTNTIIKVLIETTKRIILFEDSLDVLSHAVATHGSLRSYLLSWVPDWTCKEFSDFRTCAENIASETSNYASKSTKANASFQDADGGNDGLALKAQGIMVDVLACEIISDNPSHGKIDPFRSFETSQGYQVMSTFPAQFEDELWVL